MHIVTHQEFRQRLGEAIVILCIIIVALVVQTIKQGFSYEYFGIIIASILCLIYFRRLIIITDIFIESDQTLGSKSNVLEIVIIFLLGGLSFYLFFVKGLYGIFLLFSKFSYKIALKKLITVILAYRLIYCTSKIQTVFKAIQSK
jgi:hypothetical protein